MDEKDLRDMFDGKDDKKIDDLIEMLKNIKELGGEVEIKQVDPIDMFKEIVLGLFGSKSALKIDRHFSNDATKYVEKHITKKNMALFTKHLTNASAEKKIKAIAYSIMMSFLQEQLEKGRIILKEVDRE